MSIAAQHHLRSGTATVAESALRYRVYTVIFLIAVIALVAWGWQQRDLRLIDAGEGVGYALGILGGSMMAMMLLYSLRKRVRALSRLMPFRWWFTLHMVLGIVGPVCILFHSNFSLGSQNSTVAFFAMILMVSSGLVGRFLYRRIHHGLYGRRITLDELGAALRESHAVVQPGGERKFPAELKRLEAYVMQPSGSVRASLRRWLKVRRLSTTARRRLTRMGADRRSSAQYASHLRAITRFSFYERLFSLWHVLHIPIFVLLVVTALFHVYAVHVY